MRRELLAAAALVLGLASACGGGGADCTDSFNAANQCLSGSATLTPAYCDLGKKACYDCVLAAATPTCRNSAIQACFSAGQPCGQ